MYFDLNDIDTLETVIVNNVYTTAKPSYSQYINLEFQPDYMIVNQINYTNSGQNVANASFMMLLSSSIIGGDYLFSVSGAGIASQITAVPTNVVSNNYVLHTPFKITQPIRGSFTFNIVDVTGNPVTATALNMALSFSLIFIKLKNNDKHDNNHRSNSLSNPGPPYYQYSHVNK